MADLTVLCNLRDVGGLPLADGGVVTSGVLYRGDAPVIGDNPPELQPWPPRTVVDLRAPEERDSMQVPEPWPDGTLQLREALLGKLNPVEMNEQQLTFTVERLGMLYREMLADTAAVIRVVSAMATGPTPVLVHCSGGKDRTSLVVSLVLDAVGVPWEVLEDEHVKSNAALPILDQRLAVAMGVPMRKPVHGVDVESFRIGTAVWREHPGGAEGWLLDHDLPAAELATLCARLTG